MGEPARTLELEADREVIAPQPGPQMAFAQCDADLAVFGGGAGGGKTFALLYEAGKWAHVPGYRAILFRRTSPQLTGNGGIWEESQAIYRALGGRPRGGNTLDWRFDAGARIQFRHLAREEDRFAHQGGQYAFVGFDELTHFTEAQFWYLFGRLRSTCGVRPYLRATCNPDPDSFVFRLIGWWIGEDGYPIAERAGVLRWFVRVEDELVWFASEAEARAAYPREAPKSLTFIPSRIYDNRALLAKDPDAVGKLQAGGRIERARLLDGNWRVREAAGTFFRRDEFELADGPPSPIVRTVRAWDKASTEPSTRNPNPDWTRGVRMSLCERGEVWIDHVESVRAGPVDVLKLMRATAEEDGAGVTVAIWQDTGGAGVVDVEVTRAALDGFEVDVVESWTADKDGLARGGHRSSRAKRAFARVWAPWVEQGRVHVLRGQGWTSELLAECDAFPDAAHDDLVDACSLGAQVIGRERGTSLLEAMEAVRL